MGMQMLQQSQSREAQFLGWGREVGHDSLYCPLQLWAGKMQAAHKARRCEDCTVTKAQAHMLAR